MFSSIITLHTFTERPMCSHVSARVATLNILASESQPTPHPTRRTYPAYRLSIWINFLSNGSNRGEAPHPRVSENEISSRNTHQPARISPRAVTPPSSSSPASPLNLPSTATRSRGRRPPIPVYATRTYHTAFVSVTI